MRLNKKKLAALAMSAVMAASTMPFPVLAEEFTDMADATVTEQYAEDAGVAYEVTSVTFNYNAETGKATATYKAKPVGGTEPEAAKTVDATVVPNSLIPATCGDGYVQLQVTLYGTTYYSGVKDAADAIVLKGTGNHDWDTVIDPVIKPATHMHPGVGTITKTCKVCGKVETTPNAVLDQQAHTWSTEASFVAGENILKDKDGNIVLGEDGKPQAKDDSKDATYAAVYKCTEYGKQDADSHTDDGTTTKYVTIPAKTGAYAMITAVSDTIKTTKEQLSALAGAGSDGKIKNPTVTLPIDEDKIELKDCSKEGSYTVSYYTAAGKFKSSTTFKVAPHHYNVKKVAVFATADDKSQCTVKTDSNGNVTGVTSNSCYKSVDYEEVTLCTTTGKCSEKQFKDQIYAPAVSGKTYVLKREKKTAEPVGSHVIKQEAKDAVDDLVSVASAAGEKVKYDDLKAVAEIANFKNYITISASPACGQEGKVTVSYICMVDRKTVVTTQEITAVAAPHKWGNAEEDRSTYVAPTCSSLGHYDAVVKCTVCGTEKPGSRTTVKIPRLKHTNELSVTESGNGTKDFRDTLKAKNVNVEFEGNTIIGEYKADQTFTNQIGRWYSSVGTVEANAITTCDKCDHTVVLTNDVIIKVVDVQKQDASGHAGRITLKATYTQTADATHPQKVFTATKTFAYFDSVLAYVGRVDDEPEVVDGLRLVNGEYRYYKDGKFDPTFTGFTDYSGGRFYVINGVVATNVSGLTEIGGTWYLLAEGQLLKNYTGTAMYDGEWFYVTNGKLDATINGLVPYNGGIFMFSEGRLRNDVNGLWQNFDGSWYYLALGQVQAQHTGVVEYNGSFFYVRNGKLATDYNGTVEYDGAKFNVVAGQLYE